MRVRDISPQLEAEPIYETGSMYLACGVDALEDFATEVEAVTFHDRLIAAWPHLAGQEG